MHITLQQEAHRAGQLPRSTGKLRHAQLTVCLALLTEPWFTGGPLFVLDDGDAVNSGRRKSGPIKVFGCLWQALTA